MAPRPHNSGHYTLDACDVSQFELQVRTLVGLPLAAPRQHSPAIMLNLLGDLSLQGSPDFAQVLALPGAHLHLYGKLQAKSGRKMGHLTLTAATVAQVQAKALAAASIGAAADTLGAGGLLGLPTETVYGLAADADNAAAVAKIFAAKGRPADHPLIVHVTHAAAAAHFANEVPAFAQALMQAFWPGPLTLILPRRPGVAAAAAGGQDSIGLRCPAHPVALAVLAAC
eukprot:gene60484-80665_t